MSTYVCILAVVLVSLTHYILHKWRNPKCNGKLLPGSSGIPLIGETLELFIPSYTLDIQPFIKKRLQRYGLLFRTNIAGRNIVISADPEFNRYVFQQEEKLVVRWYLDSYEAMFKLNDLNGVTIHKYTRNVVLSQFGIEKLFPQFEQVVLETIKSWCSKDSIEVKTDSLPLFAIFGAKLLYNSDPENLKELISNYFDVSKSLMSFPINIPGTAYHKSMKDKDKMLNIIKNIVQSRLAASPSENIIHDDLLDKIIKDMNTNIFLTEEFIPQFLFSISFALFESIPTMLQFALKFISDNPAVLRELIAEHEQILNRRKSSDSWVTLDEYKSMCYTHQVIHESLRLANGVPGVLRKVVKDIQMKGYTIPAGWGIMVCSSVTHLDPAIFEDPLTFNPGRWKDVESDFIRKNLNPFGGGMKQCAGADYAKASMAIFLHVLVTKYRWVVVKGGDIIQNPILHFKNGVHINVSKKNEIVKAQ